MAAPGKRGHTSVWPLAEAKLAAPRPRSGLLDRPRVLRALDAGADAALTLVAAPPGFGKTTAVRDWCAKRTATHAWVTLDSRDDDPLRLWTYIATAIDRCRPGLGRPALGRLHAADGLDRPLDELLNGIASFTDGLVLVLDDLHAVTGSASLASLDYALEHLPANARVIAITRVDPALRLGRLRAGGALAELRAEELAFTLGESRELLVERGRIDVGAPEVQLLHARTEGWPAALALAALWLRRVDDPGAVVREFGGKQRFVAEYLTSEVIGALDEGLRSFLLRASVLGRFTAELCDGVLGRSDSASLIAELERSTQLVVRLEPGGWHRVHSLVADLGELRLAAEEPGAATEIHRRAARWLVAEGLPVEAAEHAASAGEQDLVVQLLIDHHRALIGGGGARTLLSWVRELPAELVVANPALATGGAMAATMVGETVQRRRLLHLADRARSERPDRFTPGMAAIAATVRAAAVDTDVGRAVREGRRAVALAQDGAQEALVAALAAYARALYLAGDADAAWDTSLRAIEHPESMRPGPDHAFARSTLAIVAAERGRLEAARIHAAAARSLPSGLGSNRCWLGANAAVAAGVVHLAEGAGAEAERQLAAAEHFFRDEVESVHHVWLLLLLARARCLRGRLAEAEATCREAALAIRELADPGRVPWLAVDVRPGDRALAQPRRHRASCSSRPARRSSPCSACSTRSCRCARSASSCTCPRTPSEPTRARCIASST